MKQRILLGLILLFLLASLLILVNQSRLASIGLAFVSREAAKHNIALQFKNPSFALIGLTADELLITSRLNQFVINLPFKNTRILLPAFSLLGAAKKIDLSTELFSGQIIINLSDLTLAGQKATLSTKIDKLRLNEIDILNFFGLTSGLVSLSSENFALNQNSPRGAFKFNIRDLNKPSVSKFPALLTGLPLDLEVPEILNLNLDTQIRISPIELEVSEFSLQSNLITILSLTGKTRFRSGAVLQRPENLNYQGEFTLTEAGQGFLGSYLSLFGVKPAPVGSIIKFNFSQNLLTGEPPSIKFDRL